MPIGSSIRRVSLHVKAIMLDRAIMIPGSNSRRTITAYSSHHPFGTEECRKIWRPSFRERQSPIPDGRRQQSRTLRGMQPATPCSTSSTALGDCACPTASVNVTSAGMSLIVSQAEAVNILDAPDQKDDE